LTEENSDRSSSANVNRNHGLAGDDMPAIMPAANTFRARDAVESIIALCLRLPLLRSDV